MGTYRREGDIHRPNHFVHDSLGDPFDCDEDHNHPDRSEKNFAASFLVVAAGVFALAGFGFAALIHRLLF